VYRRKGNILSERTPETARGASILTSDAGQTISGALANLKGKGKEFVDA
jgi:hypothetical protein